MKLKLIIAATMLGLAMPAAADYETNYEAYEVWLSDIRLPQSETGTITFKPCSSCEFRTHYIDSNIRWLLNGAAVSFEEFQAATRRVTERNTKSVTVLRNPGSDRVTRVSIYLYREAQ
jgi:hypothetical protein